MDYKLLAGIKSPEDVKKLNSFQIASLCEELRAIIIDTVSKNGGHLASNLGAVELTVALHRAFSTPEDALIFDVGHQSYTHKLLTGRFDKFSTIRTDGGLSGFMRPQESEHDAFVTGHSSNSISAAYGIYRAKRLSGQAGTAVAVIGDGAMTGGMAYEALNNAGANKGNFIVVLNDNKMSISRNVGSVAKAFTNLRNRPKYHQVKFAVSKILVKIPFVGAKIAKFILWVKESIKGLVYRKNIFSSLGFNYLGPVDGHDVAAMENLFKTAKEYNSPCLVHVVTKKGKGYKYAESKPKNYHGVSPFDVETGACESGVDTYSDIAGKTLCELAEQNGKICAVTAAMTSGTGLSPFAERFQDRLFDVGIAEQHALTFSAALTKGGMIPFFAVYSSFLQRAYDQIIHDAAIEQIPIKLLVDRAGIVGEDGESHQGMFDVAFLSSVPGMEIYSPCYYSELKRIIKETAQNNKMCAIRYPRGCENNNFSGDFTDDFTIVNGGHKKAVITYGRVFSNAVEAFGSESDVSVIKLNKIYPISDDLIECLKGYDRLHFFEEGIKTGSIAQHIGSRLLESGFGGEYKISAIDSQFVPGASVSQLMKKYGLDADSMRKAF